MTANTTPAWRRYLTGAALTAASVLVRFALDPVIGDKFPYTTLVLAVLAAAPLAGAGPAALVVLVGGPALFFLIGAGDVARLASAVLVDGLIIWVVALLQRAHRRAAASAQVADQRLEQLRIETMQRAREEWLSSQLRAVVESSEDAIIAKDLKGVDSELEAWGGADFRLPRGGDGRPHDGRPDSGGPGPRGGGHPGADSPRRPGEELRHRAHAAGRAADSCVADHLADPLCGRGNCRSFRHRPRHHRAAGVRGAVAADPAPGEFGRTGGWTGARFQQSADRNYGQRQPGHGRRRQSGGAGRGFPIFYLRATGPRW